MHDLSESDLLETLDQLKKIRENNLSFQDKDLAARAVATEIGTEPFLFDMWIDEHSSEDFSKILSQTIEHGQKILASKRKPDDRDAILSGDEFGVVFIPTELLRQLWGLGEAVIHFRDGTGNSSRVEPRAIQVLELSAKWVKDARVRWGTPDRVEKVNVGPLTREEQSRSLPF